MKCFQSVQTRLAIVGIASSQGRINKNMLTTILCYGSNIFCNIVYFFHEANTSRQYTESTYLTCSSVTVAAGYIIIVLNIEDLFEFFGSMSKMVDESK